jgi:hypothetical protein
MTAFASPLQIARKLARRQPADAIAAGRSAGDLLSLLPLRALRGGERGQRGG